MHGLTPLIVEWAYVPCGLPIAVGKPDGIAQGIQLVLPLAARRVCESLRAVAGDLEAGWRAGFNDPADELSEFERNIPAVEAGPPGEIPRCSARTSMDWSGNGDSREWENGECDGAAGKLGRDRT